MKTDTENIVTVSDVAQRASKVIADAEGGRDMVITRSGRPTAALVSIARMNHFERLEEIEEDLGLLALALARTLTDNGNRTPMDKVLAEFGLTREELGGIDPDSED